MGDKIQVSCADGTNSTSNEGIADTRVHSTGNDNNRGFRIQRPYTHVSVMSDKHSPEPNSAVSEREVVKNDTGRISGAEKKTPRTAFVGKKGIFVLQ